jgi:hypothetical protein
MQRSAAKADERQRRNAESAAAKETRNRRREIEAEAREAEHRRLADVEARQAAARAEQEKLKPAQGRAVLRGSSAWAPVLLLVVGHVLAILGVLGIVLSLVLALVFLNPLFLLGAAYGFAAVIGGTGYVVFGSLGTATIRTASATEDMLALMVQERQERLEAEARAAAGHRPPLAEARPVRTP